MPQNGDDDDGGGGGTGGGDSGLSCMWVKKTELKQNSNQLKQEGVYLTHISGNSGMAVSRDLNDISALLLDISSF